MSIVLDQQWEPEKVVLSAAMAFLGAYSGVSLAELYRVSFRHKMMSTSGILFLAGISIAAAAIWSKHFVGMGAMKLVLSNEDVVKQHINITETFISLLSAVVLVYGGLLMSTKDKMFSLDKEEVVDLVLSKVNSFAALRDKHVLLKKVLLRGLAPLAIGGVASSAGVCCMHFIGMTAVIGDLGRRYGSAIHRSGGCRLRGSLLDHLSTSGSLSGQRDPAHRECSGDGSCCVGRPLHGDDGRRVQI